MTFKNVYVGGTLCKNVYVGTQLVWTQAPQLRTYSRAYTATSGTSKGIYLTKPGMPLALFDYPERVVEVRFSTGLILPYTKIISVPTDGIFAITLADTMANLGVPLNTPLTLEIDYWPE